MARIVPSQAREFLERMFPFAITQRPGNDQPLNVGHSAMAAGLVDLIDQIPEELITLEGNDYATFITSLAAIRDSLALWRSGSGHGFNWTLTRVTGLPHLSPVTLIRTCLLKCPDEAPAPGTTQLAFVTDHELRDSIRLDISAADANLRNGEWKGATVLAGAAVEALLVWAIQDYEGHNPGSRAAAVGALLTAHTITKTPDPNPERWDLHEYTEVAAHLQLIKPETAAQVRQARNFRNLIHPGRAARLGQTCDRGTALAAIAAVELVVRDLRP